VRIGFDQQVFMLQEYGGISRYFCSLAKHLSQIGGVDNRIVAPFHFNKNLAALGSPSHRGVLLPKVNSKAFRVISLLNKPLARWCLERYSPDIVHETYFTIDDYRPSNHTRRVVTVYDLIHERYSQLFEGSLTTSTAKKQSVMRADQVICISENTRNDLIEIYGVPKEKTSVIYLGVDPIFLKPAGELKQAKDTPPFFLYVGKRDGYKNFTRFLYAVGKSTRLKRDFNVVCFGGGVLQPHELILAKELGLKDTQLCQIEGDDSILSGLYQRATALVYPSLYEGFGLPPIEAMASGCPVICSSAGSLPEIVGSAGEFFEPLDEYSIMASLENIALSSSRQQELIDFGYLQHKKYTWENCARETAAIYAKCLGAT
jgi:glycosyltransferase involved in cell wall biosynthesis